jgi:spore coat protein A
MDQSARLVWYHDHAIGITRTNAYSGIASALVITDAFETYLLSKNLLPDLVGIPLVIQDKTFLDRSKDSSYPITTALDGDLWYPWEYEKNSLPNGKGRWDYGPDFGAVISHPDLPAIAEVPEFFADTAMVNGAPYPALTLTEGTFRFRLLNASQARFWHLNLYEEDGTTGEIKLVNNTPVAGPVMYQIGTEGGFLPDVVPHLNGTPIPLDLVADPTGNTAIPDGPFNLLLAPAERADVLIDFTGKAGKRYILFNDAPAPFPGGDPRNDYYTGDPDFTAAGNNSYGLSGGAAPTVAGSGPNTRTIMEIVVGSGTNGFVLDSNKLNALSKALKRNFTGGNPVVAQQPPLLYQSADAATPGLVPYMGPVNRRLTLNEDFDDYGRLIQREGTTDNINLTTVDGLTVNGLNNQGLPTWGRSYLDDPTETPNVGAVEVWEIYNLTGDTHPIHFHLVNVQVIQRAKFDASMPTFAPISGTERLPDANEIGWKETVRMNGVNPITNRGEVTTVIVKFDLPKVPFTVNPSTRDAIPAQGNEYVWHCHILEHEEHDMMRPLVVVGPSPLAVYPPSQTDPKKSVATYAIYNGVPPYAITSDDKKFPPSPATVGASGGTFTVQINKGINPHNNVVTYTIRDSAGTIVTATLTITKK